MSLSDQIRELYKQWAEGLLSRDEYMLKFYEAAQAADPEDVDELAEAIIVARAEAT